MNTTNKVLDFLANKQLIQLCIGSQQLILNFEDEISISIESSFQCELALGKADSPISASPLLAYLGKITTHGMIGTDDSLMLRFSSGEEIRIFKREDNLESYQIVCKDEMVVVI